MLTIILNKTTCIAPFLFILKSFPLTQTLRVSPWCVHYGQNTELLYQTETYSSTQERHSKDERQAKENSMISKCLFRLSFIVDSIKILCGWQLFLTLGKVSWAIFSLSLYFYSVCLFIMTESTSNYWVKHCKHAHKHLAGPLWELKTWIASSSSYREKAQSFYPWKHAHTAQAVPASEILLRHEDPVPLVITWWALIKQADWRFTSISRPHDSTGLWREWIIAHIKIDCIPSQQRLWATPGHHERCQTNPVKQSSWISPHIKRIHPQAIYPSSNGIDLSAECEI